MRAREARTGAAARGARARRAPPCVGNRLERPPLGPTCASALARATRDDRRARTRLEDASARRDAFAPPRSAAARSAAAALLHARLADAPAAADARPPADACARARLLACGSRDDGLGGDRRVAAAAAASRARRAGDGGRRRRETPRRRAAVARCSSSRARSLSGASSASSAESATTSPRRRGGVDAGRRWRRTTTATPRGARRRIRGARRAPYAATRGRARQRSASWRASTASTRTRCVRARVTRWTRAPSIRSAPRSRAARSASRRRRAASTAAEEERGGCERRARVWRRRARLASARAVADALFRASADLARLPEERRRRRTNGDALSLEARRAWTRRRSLIAEELARGARARRAGQAERGPIGSRMVQSVF